MRLTEYDYSSDGLYFVTICVYQKECCLGRVTETGVDLSEKGKLAQRYWQEIAIQFSHTFLGEFVIMPNHIHGIIGIDNHSRDMIYHISKNKSTSDYHNTTARKGGITGQHNPMLSNHSLGKIIRWYKGRCTYEIKKQLQAPFQWQSGYYEHIIRNQQALINIENYIISNPANWHKDNNNPNP